MKTLLIGASALALSTVAALAEYPERAIEVTIPAPAGGTFLFFDASPYLREGESDSLGFLGRCLDAGVLMTPGSSCGADFAKWVRICFTSESLDEHRDALERLGGVLKTIC